MDSKKKFIKNKYWKKKYQPRNGQAVTNVIQPKVGNQSGDESDDDFDLKQPLPKDGWFPESDSEDSSDLEDFSSLGIVTDKSKQNDKNWFEKELDNIKVGAEVPVDVKNAKFEENKQKSIRDPNGALKKVIKDKKSNDSADNEEDELNFLLSLKEPVYTGPVFTKKDTENDKRLVASSTNRNEQKPVKSIDLEKWLDSVLDD